jgi:hypothetical protein
VSERYSAKTRVFAEYRSDTGVEGTIARIALRIAELHSLT